MFFMIDKNYAPQEIEQKWYQYWLENKYFASKPNPNKEPYSIVIPPPNVTGVLHMGHMLNNTIQDVLIRKARMSGKEACWVPGTDHASIATEAKVVAMLKEKGIEKKDISREEFLAHAFEWKEKYGGIILDQLKKIGASCDWDRTRFTMEPSLYQAVIDTFVRLYNKGLIYRGVRMVNWDPQGKTALSDEEVIYKDVQAKLFHIQYPLVDGSGFVTIATTRPETIMADAAICVNPEDPRYLHLHGKKVLIPLINREISIIPDEYVSTDFGTGCLKVTPAHDLNDYELGIKHKLPVIDILNDDGTLNEKAIIFVGVDRFEARKRIVKQLKEEGFLTETEEYKSTVGTSERTGAVIEPKLSLQWFLKMEELAKPALDHVMNDDIQLHPAKFKNTYRSWMENVRDWCISRQLWWGQQIPAFYLQDGTVIVAKDKGEALKIAREKYQLFALVEDDLTQDPDVLDTWFSSWLWPISVFDGIENPENEDISYYYPTNDLVTGPDILFFWVARMIIAGYEWRGELPFKNVYLTGIVRDKQGRKMSKSLGNSPDPLELIEKFGADGVRSGLLFSSPAGNDLLFDDKLCEQGRNFSNKIWNAFRLMKGLQVEDGNNPPEPEHSDAIQWFESKMSQTINKVEDHFSKFRISDALLAIYNLIWDDFCGKYLEVIKPAYQNKIHPETLQATLRLFDELMRLLHPYMPFITEEIWQNIKVRKANESICVANFPKAGKVNQELLNRFEFNFEIIKKIKELRNKLQISPKLPIILNCVTPTPTPTPPPTTTTTTTIHPEILSKIANLSRIDHEEFLQNATTFVVKNSQMQITSPENSSLAYESPEKIKQESLEELAYLEGFKKSVEAKLANERFVQNAKADLVERERQKLQDTETKLNSLKEILARLA